MRSNGAMPGRRRDRPYRFGFVLTTAAGNMTRFQTLRKYADRDAEVECVWAPVKHYLEPDPYRWLPGPLRTRAIVLHEAAPVLRRGSSLDAVMFHAFEPYALTALRSQLRPWPLLVWSQDDPPYQPPPGERPAEGGYRFRPRWRAMLRYRFDLWCARRVALFVPFSRCFADRLIDGCGIPAAKVRTINTGLDLELWPYAPMADGDRRPTILFVGGDFVRKGGDLLLEVYRRHFSEQAELHLVTGQAPADRPAGVQVHTGLRPNDERLRRLYATADVFVLPTRADAAPWVVLEAMASGRPVIATDMEAIPDFIEDGVTGYLMPRGDLSVLAARLGRLLADADLRRRMGVAGRRRVEQEFNAARNVPRILDGMKQAVATARGAR